LYSWKVAERIQRSICRATTARTADAVCVQLSRATTNAAVGVEPRPDQLHEQATDRVGEGVPFQPLPDARAPHRDRRVARPQRDAGQDLVPEPAYEAKEATEDPAAAAAAAGDLHHRVRDCLDVDSRAAGQSRGDGVVDAARPWTGVACPRA